MKWDIFNLENIKCVSDNISFNDLYILKYIYQSLSSDYMRHYYSGDCKLVWITTDKFINDLSYLNLSKSTLRRYLQKLESINLIYTEHIKFGTDNGSKRFFTITDITMWCIEDDYNDMDFIFNTVVYKSYKGDNMKPRNYLNPPKSLFAVDDIVTNKPSSKDRLNEMLKMADIPESICKALEQYFAMRKSQLYCTKDRKYTCSFSRLSKYTNEVIDRFTSGEMTEQQILDRIFVSTENKWGYIGWIDYNFQPNVVKQNIYANMDTNDGVEGRGVSSGIQF